MSSTKPLILVTGVTGFLGSHVVHQLLEAGYRVRGTARAAKVAVAQEGYVKYGKQYEVVAFDDLVSGDYTPVLKDVEAVIHVAAPLPGRADPSEAIDAAVEGSLNLLRTGEKLGIKRYAIVSSIVAVKPDADGKMSGKSFSDGTREDALNPEKNTDPFYVYAIEKTLAELAVWEFAERHPHLDITTVNPPFFFGPFAPGYRAAEANINVLSTNMFIYYFLKPDGSVNPYARAIDVRDVARGLIGALDSPPTKDVGRKRILMSGEWFSWKDAAEVVAKERPALKDRIAKAAWATGPAPPIPIDNTRAKEVLGLDLTPWKTFLLDAVDSVVALENEWKSKGLTPP